MNDKKIEGFQGEHRWLSNFWMEGLEYHGIWYPSAEHAYQAAKTLDPVLRKKIANLPMARDAKRAGAVVELRPDWETNKVEIMKMILWSKFSVLYLRHKLIQTAPLILVETNEWKDRFWGVYHGKGQNQLGLALMEIRDGIIGSAH